MAVTVQRRGLVKVNDELRFRANTGTEVVVVFTSSQLTRVERGGETNERQEEEGGENITCKHPGTPG